MFDQSTMERVAVNRTTFRRRWSEEIASRPCLEALDRYPHRLVAARDFTSDRILVVGDLSDRGPEVAEAIARRWPAARVTLLLDASGSDHRVPALLAAGVEVVVPERRDWEAWLDGRRFHYSAVVRGGGDRPDLDAALARTQPQAMVVLDRRGSDTHAGALRRADVVLCASEEDRLFVAAAAPGTPTVVLPLGSAPTTPLVKAMSQVGLAPPPADLERRAARA